MRGDLVVQLIVFKLLGQTKTVFLRGNLLDIV